jgi:uncharacterized protein YjbJ (UPF0337 family)
MNSDIARGNWQQLKGILTAQWGRVTGDRLRVVTGRHLQLAGRLRVVYGSAKVEIGRQIDGVQRRSRALRAKTGV